MTRPVSAALPFAWVTLRSLIVLNWAIAAAILVLLLLMPNERWIMSALDLNPSPETTRIVWSLRGVAMVGLVAAPLNHLVLARLAAMVGTVRDGDPFVAANADRLRAIAWSLLGLQLLGLAVMALAKTIAAAGRTMDFDGTMSISGWLAVLLSFVLARVFDEGAAMRADLDGTI